MCITTHGAQSKTITLSYTGKINGAINCRVYSAKKYLSIKHTISGDLKYHIKSPLKRERERERFRNNHIHGQK